MLYKIELIVNFPFTSKTVIPEIHMRCLLKVILEKRTCDMHRKCDVCVCETVRNKQNVLCVT